MVGDVGGCGDREGGGLKDTWEGSAGSFKESLGYSYWLLECQSRVEYYGARGAIEVSHSSRLMGNTAEGTRCPPLKQLWSFKISQEIWGRNGIYDRALVRYGTDDRRVG